MCFLLIAGCIVSINGDGFHNGPVTFGSGNQDHPGGAKSFSTFTLGGSHTVNTNAVPKVSTVTTQGMKLTISLYTFLISIFNRKSVSRCSKYLLCWRRSTATCRSDRISSVVCITIPANSIPSRSGWSGQPEPSEQRWGRSNRWSSFCYVSSKRCSTCHSDTR